MNQVYVVFIIISEYNSYTKTIAKVLALEDDAMRYCIEQDNILKKYKLHYTNHSASHDELEEYRREFGWDIGYDGAEFVFEGPFEVG
jgi:hypothetical protein